MRNKAQLAIIVLGIISFCFIAFYIYIRNYSKDSSQINPIEKSYVVYSYIDNIVENGSGYTVYSRKIDFLSQSECEVKNIDSPSGFCLTNEQPTKEYRADRTVKYRAMIKGEDGWGAGTNEVSITEFYSNFIGKNDSLYEKQMFFRGIEEAGLYKIYFDENNQIVTIEGVYTP